jgi:hypothetical protein
VNNFVVRLDGTTDIAFTGLRFEANAAAPNGRLIEIRGAAAARIVIKNCTFLGLPGTTTDAASLVTVATPEMPGLSVTGSTFTQGYIGLDLSEDAFGMNIDDNVFDGQDAFGARLRGTGNVEGNQVNDGPTSRFAYVGLAVSSALEGIEVLGNTVVVKRGTTGLSAPGAAAVLNNTVAMSSPSGLRGLEAGGALVAHNTVRTTLNAHALETAGSTPTTLRGNLLLSIGNGAALRVTGSVAASDHNNLYSAGASVVSQGATGYATLAAWQAASGQDGASVSRTVSFVSIGTSPDLHLAGASLTDPFLIAGTIPEVPRDADGALRDSYNAKMGADEGTPLPPLDNADAASGLYHVAGTSPAFATPQAFFDHLARRGMKGPVTAYIRPGTFTLQASLPSTLRVGAAAANPAAAPLLISRQPASSRPTLTATGVSAAANWLLRLDGTDHVRLDNLNFQAQPGDYGTLLRLDPGADAGGADDLTVYSCTFTGESTSSISSNRTLVVTSAHAHERSQWTFNSFTNGSGGVAYGGLISTDTEFVSNTFQDQPGVGITGSFRRSSITENVFQGSGDGAMDFRFAAGYTVLRNRILLTSPTSVGIRLTGADGTPSEPSLLANNLIRADRPVVTSNLSTGFRIVHNTLYANGTTGVPLAITTSGDEIAELAGNLLISATGQAALLVATSESLSASDGNVFWSTGPTLVRFAGTDHATLDAYQTATGLDGGSRAFLPSFVNTVTDLHLAPTMDGDARFATAPVAGVTTDVDGQTRGTVFAYAGADEMGLLAPLAGTYIVGVRADVPDPDFDTLHDALFAVETLGVTAQVSLMLPPMPLIGPFTIRPFAGASATNRLRLVGAPNPGTVLNNPGTGTADNAALRIEGADHVMLQALAIRGTLGSGGFGRGLELSGDVENLRVLSVDFLGRTGSTSTDAALVFAGSGTTTDLLIQNSNFLNGAHGIHLTASPGTSSTGTVLSNVTMTGVAGGGVRLDRHAAPLLDDVVVTTTAATATHGIRLGSGAGAIVSRSQISLPASAASGRALMLVSQSGTAGAPVRVENSFLTAAKNALYAAPVNHLRVVHTSMLATGEETLFMSSGTNHVFRNNVLVQTGTMPVLQISSFLSESDHNVLRATGPTFAIVRSVPYATLAEYQAATGRDGASVNVPVTFANTTTGDLHLAGASIGHNALAAPPLPDVPRDFDNVLRSTTAVYRGADESETPLTASVTFSLSAFLQGAYQGTNTMRASLAPAGLLPLAQPYAQPGFDGTAMDYDGSESVPAGFFAANPNVVDWVLVGLRTTPTGPDVARRALLLHSNATVREGEAETELSFPVLPGTYHVVVYHRNHLPVMSTARSLSGNATPIVLIDPANVYGGAAAGADVPPGLLSLVAGDGDASGSVLAGDRQAVWLPTVGQGGYLPGDFNLDGNVLADDRQALWAPNVGRQTSVPGASLTATPTDER